MLDKPNRTTLSGITPKQLLRLKHLALEATGELSVSALIRLIADHGKVIKHQRDFDWLVVEIPPSHFGPAKGEPDGD